MPEAKTETSESGIRKQEVGSSWICINSSPYPRHGWILQEIFQPNDFCLTSCSAEVWYKRVCQARTLSVPSTYRSWLILFQYLLAGAWPSRWTGSNSPVCHSKGHQSLMWRGGGILLLAPFNRPTLSCHHSTRKAKRRNPRKTRQDSRNVLEYGSRFWL